MNKIKHQVVLLTVLTCFSLSAAAVGSDRRTPPKKQYIAAPVEISWYQSIWDYFG